MSHADCLHTEGEETGGVGGGGKHLKENEGRIFFNKRKNFTTSKQNLVGPDSKREKNLPFPVYTVIQNVFSE